MIWNFIKIKLIVDLIRRRWTQWNGDTFQAERCHAGALFYCVPQQTVEKELDNFSSFFSTSDLIGFARACFFFSPEKRKFLLFFWGNFKSENKFREKSAARDVFSFVGCFRLKERIIFVELFRLNVGPILEKINLKLWKLETNCQMLVLWRLMYKDTNFLLFAEH